MNNICTKRGVPRKISMYMVAGTRTTLFEESLRSAADNPKRSPKATERIQMNRVILRPSRRLGSIVIKKSIEFAMSRRFGLIFMPAVPKLLEKVKNWKF